MINPRQRKTLLQEISLQELYHVRSDGLTNREIADSIGVSYATIYRYIGKQDAKKGQGIPMKPRPTQTEKFMSRLERRDMKAVDAHESHKPDAQDNNSIIRTHPGHDATEPVERHDTTTDRESRIPAPVRVVKEYIIGDGIRIIWENGRITITGADNLDGASVRLLCRTLMLMRPEQEGL